MDEEFLQKYRDEIDIIDDSIISALKLRRKTVLLLQIEKLEAGMPTINISRENFIQDRYRYALGDDRAFSLALDILRYCK